MLTKKSKPLRSIRVYLPINQKRPQNFRLEARSCFDYYFVIQLFTYLLTWGFQQRLLHSGMGHCCEMSTGCSLCSDE